MYISGVAIQLWLLKDKSRQISAAYMRQWIG